jgi:hypothetical protein
MNCNNQFVAANGDNFSLGDLVKIHLHGKVLIKVRYRNWAESLWGFVKNVKDGQVTLLLDNEPISFPKPADGLCTVPLKNVLYKWQD